MNTNKEIRNETVVVEAGEMPIEARQGKSLGIGVRRISSLE